MLGDCGILIELRGDLEECFLMFVDNLIHKNNSVVAAGSHIRLDNVWRAVFVYTSEMKAYLFS